MSFLHLLNPPCTLPVLSLQGQIELFLHSCNFLLAPLVFDPFFFDHSKLQFCGLSFILHQIRFHSFVLDGMLLLEGGDLRRQVLNLFGPELQSKFKLMIPLLAFGDVVVGSGGLDELLCVEPVASHCCYYIVNFGICHNPSLQSPQDLKPSPSDNFNQTGKIKSFF